MNTPHSVSAYAGHGLLVVKFVWSLVSIYTPLLALRTYVRIRIVREGGLLSLILAYVAWVSVVINRKPLMTLRWS